ncbi:hypothetical protein [Nonomuraea sp. LPB2021202275-12-8]|uniref:hypothetical protein n=1 Tax=Nonomuraea sp. LPB2021202275-12-8 TaxID=3120159 RepID=UPI00300C4893
MKRIVAVAALAIAAPLAAALLAAVNNGLMEIDHEWGSPDGCAPIAFCESHGGAVVPRINEKGAMCIGGRADDWMTVLPNGTAG